MSGDAGSHIDVARRATLRTLVAALALGACVLVVARAPASAAPARRATTSADLLTGRVAAVRQVTPASATQWVRYHAETDGAGVATESLDLSKPSPAWHSPRLDGAVYGEPLEATGRVVVATENDTVYALAADSGAVLWSTHVGTPVPSGDLPCGNIAPSVGITGTPVIDLARSEVFAVADELVGGTPAHHLVGIDLYTGKVLLNRVVDPPGAEAAAILQRTGLDLDGGRVVFGFGGNYGDCGPYHGWVVSVPADGDGPTLRYDTVTLPGDHQGAVWMGGAAPEVAQHGDIWVATGNGAATSGTFDDSDSVVELSPSLHRIAIFAPGDWGADNADDRDLGSTAPALLSDGDVVQVGKSYTAYLLRASKLGGVGGQISSTPVCDGTDADGGDAVDGDVVYVACQAGLEALDAGTAKLTVRWDAARTVGSNADPDKPPIVAGGLVWSIGGDTLFGIAPASGRAVVRLDVGSNDNDFPTPSVADGLLLVTGGTGGDEVLAFAGGAGLPVRPAPAPR
ncbi:MAG TPA: PQQ-binding-like beta-propeller repeat protein [Acidimicrobiales bacterium]|nr:PQQ-binding-like beta-propeller repeat protein [Acidimicrobiales bacterium]